MIEAAPGIPMSASVRVNRDDLLDLLDEAVASLPDELRAARWLLKERDEYLQRTRREAEELIAEARTQVAHMVQKAEVVKAAEQRARHMNEEAEANARRMRREAEDFCDQRLASFENVLAKVQRSVAVGRQRLAAPTLEESELRGFDDGDELAPSGGDEDPGGPQPYDQER
jgi:cell division septum initiation protein DivIVA